MSNIFYAKIRLDIQIKKKQTNLTSAKKVKHLTINLVSLGHSLDNQQSWTTNRAHAAVYE